MSRKIYQIVMTLADGTGLYVAQNTGAVRKAADAGIFTIEECRKIAKGYYLPRGAKMIARRVKETGFVVGRKNPHKAGTADKAAARELKIFIDSEPRFDSRRVAISKNLEAKFKRKTYSDTKAAKAWETLATDDAKTYAREYARAGEWNTVFSAATRRLAARLMARDHAVEMRAGNFH